MMRQTDPKEMHSCFSLILEKPIEQAPPSKAQLSKSKPKKEAANSLDFMAEIPAEAYAFTEGLAFALAVDRSRYYPNC
jgi:hypothetical protein